MSRAGTEGCKTARLSKTRKAGRSPDWSLQLDSMKSESLVSAGQNTAVNTCPGLVHTARHTMRVESAKRGEGNRKEPADHGRLHDWGEVGTR